jgi:hypothetical protein
LHLLLVFLLGGTGYGQEKFGSTFNLGVGLGSNSGNYRYAGHNLPVLYLDYEIDVVKYFTLAPFISFYSYNDRYNQGGTDYTYRQTVIPIGVKGTYYFDDLLNLDSNWDIYGAGSLGVVIAQANWDNNYDGDPNYYRGNSLYLNLHVGGEYHFNNKLGIYLDISNGLSTIGLDIH